MKKKKEPKKDKNNISRVVIISVMMLCLVISMTTYWIYAYYHKNGYFTTSNNFISYKVSDYVKVEGNIVYLKNVDSRINTDFINKQNEIINNKDVINIDVTKGIYKEILSIKINYIIGENFSNYEEILTLNIDLKENKVLNDKEILNLINKEYKDIAANIFDEYIKLSDDVDILITDAITEEKISSKKFNQNSEKYIIRIREKLPDIINIYLDNDKVYYVVRLSEIYKVCYHTNTDTHTVNINKEIGKI